MINLKDIKPPTKQVHVDDWGGEVTIRRMTVTEFAEFMGEFSGRDEAELNQVSIQVPLALDMLTAVIVEPKATPEQMRQCLDMLPVDELLSLMGQAIEFSQAKKNSSPTPGSKRRSRSAGNSGSRTPNT